MQGISERSSYEIAERCVIQLIPKLVFFGGGSLIPRPVGVRPFSRGLRVESRRYAKMRAGALLCRRRSGTRALNSGGGFVYAAQSDDPVRHSGRAGPTTSGGD